MAAFNVYCPHCNQLLTTDSVYSGQAVACPLCHKDFTVPAMPAAAAQAPTYPPSPPPPPPAPPPPRPVPGPLDIPPWEQQYPQSQATPAQSRAPIQPGPIAPGYPPIPGYQVPPGYQTPYPSAWNPPQMADYAGFWRRFAAILIDVAVLIGLGALVGCVVGGFIGGFMGTAGHDMRSIEDVAGTAGQIVGMIVNWLYFTLMECSSKQATFGKQAMGIVVTDLQGQRISLLRANGRYWSKWLSAFTLGIGFIMAGFTLKKQALHDMIAGTLVMKH